MVGTPSPGNPGLVAGVRGMTTLLFFDDLRLNRRDNLERRIGRPQLLEDAVYRDPAHETPWGYPTVFFDVATGIWRMMYQGLAPAVTAEYCAALLAESEDGLHWRPRDTVDEIDMPGRAAPNQIIPHGEFSELSACYVDERAPRDERIKGLVVFPCAKHRLATRLWVSADGLHWKRKEGVEWQQPGADPAVAVFWNEVRGSYTFTARPICSDRRIALYETRDWQTFTKPELAIHGDALDAPLTEPYGMPVIPYEGYYIGLLWLFHCVSRVKGNSPHKFLGGRVDCQLAYSLNGWHWQRTLREPFIPNGDPGQPDSGCIYPSSWVFRDNGDIDFYASASTHEHGELPEGSGTIVTYRLRRDGFVYLTSTRGPGVVGTRALAWNGGEAEFNVQCPGGCARVQITDSRGESLPGFGFDDCRPFRGDSRAWTPSWKGDRRMSSLPARTIRIEVELTNGQLYAIRGEFLPLTAGECWRLEQQGETPKPRPGF